MSDPRVDAVRRALDVALGDFQLPTPVELTFDVGPGFDDNLVRIDGAELRIERAVTEPELLVRIADFLQDQVFDQLDQTWGEARPPCPGHQHAPDPRLLDGDAWWVYPHSGEQLARIGELRG